MWYFSLISSCVNSSDFGQSSRAADSICDLQSHKTYTIQQIKISHETNPISHSQQNIYYRYQYTVSLMMHLETKKLCYFETARDGLFRQAPKFNTFFKEYLILFNVI